MLTNLDKFKTTTDHHSQVGALAAKTSALQSVLFYSFNQVCSRLDKFVRVKKAYRVT
jgi:hypothetical protein